MTLENSNRSSFVGGRYGARKYLLQHKLSNLYNITDSTTTYQLTLEPIRHDGLNLKIKTTWVSSYQSSRVSASFLWALSSSASLWYISAFKIGMGTNCLPWVTIDSRESNLYPLRHEAIKRGGGRQATEPAITLIFVRQIHNFDIPNSSRKRFLNFFVFLLWLRFNFSKMFVSCVSRQEVHPSTLSLTLTPTVFRFLSLS